VAQAQQRSVPIVGFLQGGVPEAGATVVAPFLKGLSEAGFVEGQNLSLEFRWANYNDNRLKELAADLVRRRVALIAASGHSAILAAKAATTTIPIVIGAAAADPVEAGFVASLNRPGGNVTGISTMVNEIAPKLLQLLTELAPQAARIAVLVNPDEPFIDAYLASMQTAASTIGRQIEIVTTRTSHDMAPAFAIFADKRADALLVSPATLLLDRRVQIVTLATRHAVPAIYPSRIWAEAGGLMSYGPNLADMYRQAGNYAGRILKGTKPADLPIMRPTRFEFIINLATAEALGIQVPPMLLALTDEAIE